MGKRKTLQGIVVSDKMDKTITVEVRDLAPHALYDKVVHRRTRLKAHDPENTANKGDSVRIIEYRPISKTKRWSLLEVIHRAIGSEERSTNDSTK